MLAAKYYDIISKYYYIISKYYYIIAKYYYIISKYYDIINITSLLFCSILQLYFHMAAIQSANTGVCYWL